MMNQRFVETLLELLLITTALRLQAAIAEGHAPRVIRLVFETGSKTVPEKGSSLQHSCRGQAQTDHDRLLLQSFLSENLGVQCSSLFTRTNNLGRLQAAELVGSLATAAERLARDLTEVFDRLKECHGLRGDAYAGGQSSAEDRSRSERLDLGLLRRSLQQWRIVCVEYHDNGSLPAPDLWQRTLRCGANIVNVSHHAAALARAVCNIKNNNISDEHTDFVESVEGVERRIREHFELVHLVVEVQKLLVRLSVFTGVGVKGILPGEPEDVARSAAVASQQILGQAQKLLCRYITVQHPNHSVLDKSRHSDLEIACGNVGSFFKFVEECGSGNSALSLLHRSVISVCPVQYQPGVHNDTFPKKPMRVSNGNAWNLCIDIACHYPLQSTSVSQHWSDTVQDVLGDVFRVATALFPEEAKPFNGSVLPCGYGCYQPIYTENEVHVENIVTGVTAYISLATIVVSVTAFLLNRSEIQAVGRHLLIYITLDFAVLNAHFLATPFSGAVKSMTCYEDRTIRRDEPAEFSFCSFGGVLLLLSAYSLQSLTLSLSIELYRVTRQLSDGVHHGLHSRKLEVVYVVCSTVFAVAMTAVLGSRQSLTGLKAYGSCAPSVEDSFYFIKIPLTLIAVTATGFCLATLPKLRKLRRSVTQVRVVQTGSGQVSVGRNQATMLGLLRMIQMILFNVSCLLVAVFASVGGTVYKLSSKDQMESEAFDHIKCGIVTCNPDRNCPELPRISIAASYLPHLCYQLMPALHSLWAFQWKYWKGHWPFSIIEKKKQTGVFPLVAGKDAMPISE